MALDIGSKAPSQNVKLVNAQGVQEVDFADLVADGTSVIFAVPGAFTATCHLNHMPGYIALADEFKSAGADRILCLSVNDHFVMQHWGEQTGALGVVDLVSDGNADLAKALKLDKDFSAAGFGTRYVRSSLLIKDGVISHVEIEAPGGDIVVTGAPHMLDVVKNSQ
ncbi:peroxiredoxin [Maritalea mediterranea]|uniref:Glutathione-dependent peroxiredoxin n=1 Tax=Maritalea mediterranea TaxID=2909667 RepID=A0ABS9E4K8_9HYPH|nr:peroxiredoxin [Maritalea mediterranea]MCF4097808.1 peroxiredoxin [Maritalea mediterranea]